MVATTRNKNGIVAQRTVHNEMPEDNKEYSIETSDEEYEVEKIIKSRKIKGKLHYLVRWVGYSEADDTWEPADNVLDTSIIQEFQNSNKKGQNSDDEDGHETTKKRKGVKKTTRLTKSQVIEEARKSRVENRKSLSVQETLLPVDHFNNHDDLCCLVCSSRIYSDVILAETPKAPPKKKQTKKSKGDSTTKSASENNPDNDKLVITGNVSLDKAIQATSKVASYKFAVPPDCIAESALSVALENDKINYFRAMTYEKDTRAEPSNEVINGTGSGTGFVSKNTFRHAVKTVNESRGNREGNTAFFKYITKDTMQLHRTKYNISIDIKQECLLECLRKRSLSPKILGELMALSDCCNFLTEYGVYEAASAGDLNTVSSLLSSIGEYEGFNHLHREISQNKTAIPLSSYKVNQITKKATSNKQIRPIHFAAIHPKVDYLKEFYDRLPSNEFTIEDGVGRRVAHYAAVSSTSECLNFLIENKMDVNSFDSFKMTPLLLCAMHGRVHNLFPLVKYLGDDVINQKFTKNGWTALHFAAHYGHSDMVSALINLKADVNLQDRESKASALHHATRHGHLEVVKILIQKGSADSELKDKFGRTPLHIAAKNGRFDIALCLLKEFGVESDARDTSDNTPLHYASAYGWPQIVQLLTSFGLADVNAANNWKTTPMAIADMKGHRDIVNFYLDNSNVDAGFKNQSGQTLLHIYAAASPYNLYEAQRLIEKTKRLINREKANLCTGDINGNTPLHILAASPHYVKGIVEEPDKLHTGYDNIYLYQKMLSDSKLFGDFDEDHGTQIQLQLAALCLENSSDMSVLNKDDKTPLMAALENDHLDMVLFLLQHDREGYQCRYGKENNNIFHFIMRQIAMVQRDIYACFNMNSVEGRRIVRYQQRLNNLWNYIMKDLSLRNSEAVRELINLPNDLGRTPISDGLVYANKLRDNTVNDIYNRLRKFFYNNRDMVYKFDFDWSYFSDYLVEVIVATNPDLNLQIGLPKSYLTTKPKKMPKDEPEYTGWSPLHLAASFSAHKIINLLLNSGASPNIVSWGHRDGFSPLFLCTKPLPNPVNLVNFNRDNGGDIILFPDQVLNHHTIFESFIKSQVDLSLLPFQPKNIYDIKKLDSLRYSKSLLVLLFEENTVEDIQAMLNICYKYYSSNQWSQILNSPGNHHGQNLLMLNIIERQNKKLELISELPFDLNCVDTKGNTAVMYTITANDTQLLQKLTQFSIQSNTPKLNLFFINKYMQSVLTLAGELGDIHTMELFADHIDNSSNLNHRNQSGKTALYLACHHNSLIMVEKLLQYGADPNLSCRPKPDSLEILESESLTPLAVAISNHTPQCHKIVELLLKAGARPNDANSFGNTALHLLIPSQDHRTMKLLLENGADPRMTNSYQQTPLHLAVKSSITLVDKTLRLENLLIKHGADINAVDYQGRSSLHICFSISNLIPFMRHTAYQQQNSDKAAAKIKNTKLQYIEAKQQLKDLGLGESKEIQHYIIENNLLPNLQREDESLTPGFGIDWYLASPYRDSKWEKGFNNVIKDDPIELVDFMINQKNIKIDVKDSFQRTPLHYAARVGALTSSTRLIEKGAHLETLDHDELSPFNVSLLYGHVDLSVILFKYDVNSVRKMKIHNQKDISPFSFALSKSYMPLAFMIIEKNLGFIGSIKDTLATGKFSFAYNLMLQADGEKVKLLEPDSLHNLAHAISGFSPINVMSWREYLPDFLTKIVTNQVDITALDKNHATPLILAAQHNQTDLIQELLKINHSPNHINQVDSQGRTALWHALNNSNINTASELIKHDLVVDTGDFKLNKSILYLAVTHCPSLVPELIKKGARHTIDVEFGRCSAFMASLFKSYKSSELSRVEIWKHLILAGANINAEGPLDIHQSRREAVEYPKVDKDNQPKFINVHPGFLILNFTLEEQELLLQYGLYPNVCHPTSGTPLISLIKTQKQLELFLSKSADVNIIDKNTYRPFFYNILFDELKFKLDCPIYQWNPLWISRTGVDFNLIDPVTKQSALEFAIRSDNINLLKNLMNFGANLHIKSGLQSKSVNSHQLTPINHAVVLNKIEVLTTISNCCGPKIFTELLMASDEYAWNSLFYAVRPNSIYSFQNLEVMNIILLNLKETGHDLNSIVHQKDYQGKSSIQYAAIQKHTNIYDLFCSYGCQSLPDHEISELRATYKSFDLPPVSNAKGSLGPISVEQLDSDSAKAKAALQEEQNKEKRPEKPTNPEVDLVDRFSDQKGAGVLAKGPDGELLTVVLNKTEFVSSSYTKNVVYRLQLIFNPLQEVYVLFTRWGGVGEDGMYQRTPFSSFDLGFKEFSNIFKSKTNNTWDCRHPDKFESHPKKYIIAQTVERKPVVKLDSWIKKVSKVTLPTSFLPEGLQHLMAIFRSVTIKYHSQPDHKDLTPLGQRDRLTILKARQLLETIKETIDEANKMSSSFGKDFDPKSLSLVQHKLIKLNSQYFTLIPRNSRTHGNSIDPLVTLYEWTEEALKLDNLMYLQSSTNLLLASLYNATSIHPLDYCYRALDCQLHQVNRTNPWFDLVKEYMGKDNTTYDLVDLYHVNRAADEARFAPYESSAGRLLLWHGTKLQNFMGVLSQGLRVAPIQAEMTGYMFGKGIYFADAFEKSISYSNESDLEGKSGVSCLLLCEVAVGKCYPVLTSEHMLSPKDGYDSTKGVGQKCPAPSQTGYLTDGTAIPSGQLVDSLEYKELQENSNCNSYFYSAYGLNFNEYVVYDEARVKIRAVAVVKQKSICHTCSGTASKTLVELLSKDNVNNLKKKLLQDRAPHTNFVPSSAFKGNRIEQLIASILIKNHKLDPVQFITKYLSKYFVESDSYILKLFTPALPFEPHNSLVCSDCLTKMINLAFLEYLVENHNTVPRVFWYRQPCRFGSECRKQANNSHAAMFDHGCHSANLPVDTKKTPSGKGGSKSKGEANGVHYMDGHLPSGMVDGVNTYDDNDSAMDDSGNHSENSSEEHGSDHNSEDESEHDSEGDSDHDSEAYSAHDSEDASYDSMDYE